MWACSDGMLDKTISDLTVSSLTKECFYGILYSISGRLDRASATQVVVLDSISGGVKPKAGGSLT